MQFSKLRLAGFKSFVEPVEFAIEGGLTGVVGPNGCGKSNLVEALRWVMGENSYKNMRASGMEDVIFSGSDLRPARNAAEVTLYLDNSDQSAPMTFNNAAMLQVSRRIERDKGSLYRINGREVRAKDVQLLFADQSTGARSPSMVGQGRIGELISAKPQARRALLEEAAGISGLYSRRREAELRLRATGENLDRLEDIVSDLAGRIESLKRQARQASRFKALSASIRKIEAGVFYLRWVAAKSQGAEAESRLSSATVTVADKAQVQMQAAKALDEARTRLPPLREETLKAQAAQQRLRLGAATLEEEQNRLAARREELAGRLRQQHDDHAREAALLQENAQNLQQLADEETQLRAQEQGGADKEQRFAATLHNMIAQQSAEEELLAAEQERRAERNAAQVQLQNRMAEAVQRDRKLGADIAVITAELAALISEIAALTGAGALRARCEKQEKVLLAAEEETARADAALNTARLAEARRREKADEARRHLHGLEAEARTLLHMLEQFGGGDYPAIVDDIRVEKGFEVALGAALGDDLEASFIAGAPVSWLDMAVDKGDDPALPAGVAPLARMVDAPAALARRLEQVGVVEADEAAALQPRLKVGQRLVSREGVLWRWDGLTARADALTAGALRLAQKNRLGELETLLVAANAAFVKAQTAFEAAQVAVQACQGQERDSRAADITARKQLEALHHELAAFERGLGERVSRRDALRENHGRLVADYDENRVRLAALENEQKSLPPMAAMEQTIAACNSRLAEVRGRLSEERAAQSMWQQAVQSGRNRLAAIARERKNWQARLAGSERQLQALARRGAQTRAEIDALAATPDGQAFEARRRALFDEIAKAEAVAQTLADRLAEAETTQAGLDHATLVAVQELSAAREERARAEERLHAAIDRCEEIEAHIVSALDCPPVETFGRAGFANGEALPDEAALERELDRLRLERERLGAVNLRAEEESAEITARMQALVKERDDVIEAIRKLRLAIQNLNREGRDRLLEAFEKVNVSFQRLFTHLFGGGMAELQLVESEDPLEAGLEILARPPGKKLQTMTLLSGGEQALTAMALIFAVFLTNPAPVCVLDEVDAPLDDHNVERYCNLMDEMAALAQTRFIIITHNPVTMARMNRLFGVTMGEQGVSQLVSVDLHTAEQLREPA
ncbi:MAG: Chromosome partition protein Smc [Candidatus Tokpelaia hoelldobleri]|uniref:Chromosome partition protein Smc n=1 Tax=Candidatus Tokpelaia hoelldobleri TaxID=1902579 RepID=A0A1U9JW52_9HYPH|nr:MAG: Chromosome partition protein Smc [Candidatus Tokpelaia hoelldoblerii]